MFEKYKYKLWKHLNKTYGRLLNTPSNNYDNELKFLHNLWVFEGNSHKVQTFAQYFLFCTCNNLPEIQLIYLSCLIEAHEEKIALAGLKDYINKFGFYKIEEFLLVSLLAYRNNLSNEMIKKSAFIFEKMKTYQNNFIHYLKKKTIAVVGNSPNLIGTGKGREIDKHDVVFRMNAFDLPLQFKSDLGSKTNIFVTNANFEIVNNSNTFCSYDYHFIAMDLYHINLSSFTKVSDFIENYYQLISEGEHVTFLPSEISLSLKLESKLQIATTGLKLIYLLHKNDIPFDLYGFNEKKYDNDSIVENPLKRKYECKNDFFTEEIRTSSFYKNKNIFESGHNFNEELEFRINLLSKECKK